MSRTLLFFLSLILAIFPRLVFSFPGQPCQTSADCRPSVSCRIETCGIQTGIDRLQCIFSHYSHAGACGACESCGNGRCEPAAGEDNTTCSQDCPSTSCSAASACNSSALDGCCPGTQCQGLHESDPNFDPDCCSHCGDQNVQAAAGEECEPPNTATCDAQCQTINSICDPATVCPVSSDPCLTVTCLSGSRPPLCAIIPIAGPNCTPVSPTCGDGLINPGEACDLGPFNGIQGENCGFNCQPVTATTPGGEDAPLCLNGVSEGGTELCDGGQLITDTQCNEQCQVPPPLVCTLQGGGCSKAGSGGGVCSVTPLVWQEMRKDPLMMGISLGLPLTGFITFRLKRRRG